MQRSFDDLSHGDYDLLILGGGITGAGVALDATLRGLRVALIDKGDFAAGTSSASSKLIHGGLRYLEQGQLRLVYEALAERRRLLHNAPHLVRPLRFVLPFYALARLPMWKGCAGLRLYDLLAGRDNLRGSRRIAVAALRREFPALSTNGLIGGAEYFDAQMDDARLCLEVVKTAWNLGARAANYVEAVGFERHVGRIVGAVVKDGVTSREAIIHARIVLNATGPWVDAVERLAGGSGEPRLQPSKGVHLIVPNRGLSAAFLLLHPRDGRVFFVLPWRGRTLIGTTDTFTTESADQLTVTADEQSYLLEGFNRYFNPPLRAADVSGQFAGLRPLLKARRDDPSARSREFSTWDGPGGMISLAGGKYTTYRHMAEVVTDVLARKLGNRSPCRTRRYLLDGAPREPWLVFQQRERRALLGRGLDEATAEHLMERYGRQARDVAEVILRESRLREPVVAGEMETGGEFLYQREDEMAITTEDCLMRRTRIGLFHPEVLVNSNPG